MRSCLSNASLANLCVSPPSQDMEGLPPQQICSWHNCGLQYSLALSVLPHTEPMEKPQRINLNALQKNPICPADKPTTADNSA